MKDKKGTEENYTHIIFYYEDGNKMIINKFTYEYVYPDEKTAAKSFEYIIREK